MATHSSTLAWRIPWTEEPRRALDLTEQLTLTFFHFHGNNAKEGSWIFFLTTVQILHTNPFSPSHTHQHHVFLPALASLYLRLPLITCTTTIPTPRYSSPEVPVDIQQEKFTSHSSEGRRQIRVHPGLIPGEDSLLACRRLPCHFSHTQHGERGRQRGRERPSSLLSFLVKALIPSLQHQW